MVLATFVSSGQAPNIVTNTIKSNATAIGGDSGGPLLYTFNEGTVLGVLSGGASNPPFQPNYWSSLSYVSSVLGTNVVPYTTSDHDRAFLITLYDRALHRGPDGPGFSAWLGGPDQPM